MTMTIIDNSHGDEGDDKERIDTTSNDIPSEYLRAQKTEIAPQFHTTQKNKQRMPRNSSFFPRESQAARNSGDIPF